MYDVDVEFTIILSLLR